MILKWGIRMNRVIGKYGFSTDVVKKQGDIVTKLDFLKIKFFFRLLFLGFFVVLLGLFHTWSRVKMVQTSFEVNKSKHYHMRLRETHKILQMERATLESPALFEKYSTKHEMTLPKAEQMIRLEPKFFLSAQN